MDIWTTFHPVAAALVLSRTASPTPAPVEQLALTVLAQPEVLDQLFRGILAMAAVVFLAVEGALIYAVFRSRRAEDDQDGPAIAPRPGLEIIWTLIPAVLVIIIAIFSFRALAAQAPGGSPGGGSAPAEDTAEGGRVVFLTYGCSSCHTLDPVGAEGTVGPNLDGVGTWAGTVVPGMDAQTFLHQAVLNPEAHIAKGYESGIMPTNFSERLSPSQVSGLVKFLMAQR